MLVLEVVTAACLLRLLLPEAGAREAARVLLVGAKVAWMHHDVWIVVHAQGCCLRVACLLWIE